MDRTAKVTFVTLVGSVVNIILTVFKIFAGVLGRYFFATLSGVICFGMWTPADFPNPLVYSLAYNGAYLGLEALITLILIALPPVAKALAHVKTLAQESR